MKALVGAINQEKALVGAFSVIVQPVVEPMEHYTALGNTHIAYGRTTHPSGDAVPLGPVDPGPGPAQQRRHGVQVPALHQLQRSLALSRHRLARRPRAQQVTHYL